MVNKFDLVAKDWDLKNTRVEIAMSFVNQIKNSIEIKKDFDILDYGCGTGLISFGFCHSAKSIT
ncbi:MAG: class I SAM-dependent methyltransferase, partial [Arcobacter butzleri]|nr:class I SAM-dependent methyltransferase [Aliarcobacter butzleri]